MAILLVPVVLVVAMWATWQALHQTPTRQAGVRLAPYGLVTVRLTPDPFPIPANREVTLDFVIEAAGGRAPAIDSVRYVYVPVGGGSALEAEAERLSQSAGQALFRGPAQFTQTGEWDVTVILVYQGNTGQTSFSLPVQSP